MRPVWLAYYIVGALVAIYLFAILGPAFGSFGSDAYAYWSAGPPLYDQEMREVGAYLYSPAFFQLTAPLRLLDFYAFAWIWAALNIATAMFLGPVAIASPATAFEVYQGNIYLLSAAAIVLGFRHPWTWAFILLTKVTPGVGLLWFVVRREWRDLAIALGITLAIAATSFVATPGLWFEWVATTLDRTGNQTAAGPLWLRVPAAALLVIWGARTDRAWTVLIGAMAAVPNPWWSTLAMLGGLPLILRMRPPRHEESAVRSLPRD